MSYAVKMKTGFYETTLYTFSFSQGNIQFIPAGDNTKDIINITEDELLIIRLISKKHLKFEIQTQNRFFTGTFTQDPDLREIFKLLKAITTKKVIYEEE